MQDHYENLYVVIAGTKTFTLKPPTSVHQMQLACVPVWQEHFDTCNPTKPASVEPRHGQTIEWSTVDPRVITCGSESQSLHPEAAAAGATSSSTDRQDTAKETCHSRFWQAPSPATVILQAGDMLYLPAMWYHYVTQDEGAADAVIAVNYWWDMQFDDRFAMHRLLLELSRRAGLVSGGCSEAR